MGFVALVAGLVVLGALVFFLLVLVCELPMSNDVGQNFSCNVLTVSKSTKDGKCGRIRIFFGRMPRPGWTRLDNFSDVTRVFSDTSRHFLDDVQTLVYLITQSV